MTQLYLLTPLLLWVAVRFGPAGISAVLKYVALLAITGVALGRGPFAVNTTATNTIALQMVLLVTAGPLLLLTAAITERKGSQQEVEALVARLLQRQDDERRQLARDLHDSTAQTAAIANFNLHRLRAKFLESSLSISRLMPRCSTRVKP